MIKSSVLLCLVAVALGARLPVEDPEVEEYIVGGNTTKIEDVPYQVGLYIRGRFICGGSIVSATHIVTAGHCVSSSYSYDTAYSIRAGTNSRVSGGVQIPVKKAVVHANFSYHTVDYDVAVLELSSPLQFNSSIKPITITDKEPKDGEMVKVSGWGCLKEGGGCPAYLQSVDVPMVNRKTCEKNYAKVMKITSRMICAGVEGKDACQGDSGGPLALKGKLVGIVSTGEGCARKDFPGIYTNVADPEVRKFIKQHAKV